MIKPPFYPIVYLRGYAMTRGELERTVSSPYMGFNLGSTRVRQRHDGSVRSHVFESPLIRLMKDHGYKDAYHDGDRVPKGPVCSRSIWIYRYYDEADREFGDGRRAEIEDYAEGLRDFLSHVRDAVLDENEKPGAFRVYLVAHSMGGLIARCYLQNPKIPALSAPPGEHTSPQDRGVDKLFTYGTPHGGIEFRRGGRFLERIRDFFDPNNAGNFGPGRMREFLCLPRKTPLNSLFGRFPAERVFCLVGTDSRDYDAAAGLSKRVVGPLSDGLVKIKNATVLDAPRAHVHRSHSGPYGLVNSEAGYQNLRRFLFGDLRVVVEMVGVEAPLPPDVEEEKKGGAKIRASYHIEMVHSVRGGFLELSRRTYSEESAVLRTYDRLREERPTKLLTAFLLKSARVNTNRRTLGFALSIAVRVPEYEVDGKLRRDHYESGILFADKLNVEFELQDDGAITAQYGLDSETPGQTCDDLDLEASEGAFIGTIPFGNDTRPGFRGRLRLTATRWNE